MSPDVKREILSTLLQQKQRKLALWVSRNLSTVQAAPLGVDTSVKGWRCQNPKDAKAKYDLAVTKIRKMLKDMDKKLEKHGKNPNKDWGDVGDVQHWYGELRDIIYEG